MSTNATLKNILCTVDSCQNLVTTLSTFLCSSPTPAKIDCKNSRTINFNNSTPIITELATKAIAPIPVLPCS